LEKQQETGGKEHEGQKSPSLEAETEEPIEQGGIDP